MSRTWRGCIFQGSIGYFKELDPPEDGKRFDYDRVLRMDYLFEEFDNQQKKKEELDRVIKEDEEDEVGVIDMLFPRLSKKQRTLIDITLAAIIFIVGMVILRF